MRKYIFIIPIMITCFLFACSSPETKKNASGSNSNSPVESSERGGVGDISGDLRPVDRSGETRSGGTDTKDINTKDVITKDTNAGDNLGFLAITPYYQDRDGFIIPATREIVRQEGIARAAVNCLIDSPIRREELDYFGMYPVLPQDTEILGLSIKEGIALIDFNDGFLKYTEKKAEKAIVTSLVYTLTEFDSIKGVRILIKGSEAKSLKYGTDVSGTLSRDNVLINNDSIALKEGFNKIDIYVFKTVKEKFPYLLPVSFEYEGNANKSLPGRIVELLAKQPEGGRLYSEVPQDTKLIGYSISGNLLTLNFNEGFMEYGGTAREEGIINQVAHSMKQLTDVQRIRILTGGKKVNLVEGSDVSGDIEAGGKINYVIDGK